MEGKTGAGTENLPLAWCKAADFGVRL